MIYLFTGSPGASKTLNVIKFICEDKAFKDRDIYYHRIKELTLPWIRLDEEEVMAWNTLPEGAVLIVDEAQYLMPVRDPRKPLPEWILKMSEHRHKGYDLVFITQSPMLLDAGFRRFVGRHTHIERVFGMESARHLTWEKCVTEIEDYHKRKEAVVKRVGFDKKYFGVYKSAEVHTHKRKIPAKAFVPFVMLAAAICAILYLINSWNSKGAASSQQKSSINSSQPTNPIESIGDVLSGGKGLNATKQPHATKEEYIALHTPRIADVPWSAPVYDELTQPKSFPRPQCVRFNKTEDKPEVCKCFTQQATPLDISVEACNRYVNHGYFDYTKPDDYNQSSGGVAATAPHKGLPAALAATANVPVTR